MYLSTLKKKKKINISIFNAQTPDAFCSLSRLVSQHTMQITDSIRNLSIDFWVLLLSRLPLPGPAESMLHRDHIDSGKGVAIRRSMSASAAWTRLGCRSSRKRLYSFARVCVSSCQFLFRKHTVSIDAHMDFYGCVSMQHAWEAEMHSLRVLKGRHRLSGAVESLVCLHWSGEDFCGGGEIGLLGGGEILMLVGSRGLFLLL